jgi:integrase
MSTKRTEKVIGVIEEPKGSGKFYVRVYYAGVRYKRRAASRSHARELREEIRVAIRRGEWPPRPKKKLILFDDLLTAYREEKRREGKAVMDGEIGYKRLLGRFSGRRADSLTTREMKEWRDELLPGHTPATVNRHLTLLRAILRMALRDRLLDPSALPEIEPLKENNERVRYLSEDEEQRLTDALPPLLRPLVLVGIHTGMRRGELLSLTWDDVDLLGGSVLVRKSKSGEGRRIPMSATARRTFGALFETRRERMHSPVIRQSEAARRVFTAPRGGYLVNLNRAWYRAIKVARLDGLRFHDLRHTFASRLAMSGVDLFRVQTLMGHKSSRMTVRYAHLSPEHLRAAVAKLDSPGPKPWANTSTEAINRQRAAGQSTGQS